MRNNVKFMGAFENVKDLPRHSSISEYAFVGRSNVGKSSLINAVLDGPFAKTSNTPGRTRTLNLFNWDDRIWLMDLPGYGFAKVSKDEQVRWLERLENYLSTRAELKKLFILIDARVGIKDIDNVLINFCKSEKIPYVIVWTKCDKKEAKAGLTGGIMTSSSKKTGIIELRQEIS